MRAGKLMLAVLAVAVACMAFAPVASATSFNVFVGSTQVATEDVSCSGTTCTVSITGMGGNEVRIGGPTFGFSGATAIGGLSGQSFLIDKNHKLTGPGTVCGGMTAETLCFDTTGSQTASTVTFTLTGVTGTITDVGLHVIGPACGTEGDGFATCFASSVPSTTTPEPGSMALLGTGLLSLAGIVRRRIKQ